MSTPNEFEGPEQAGSQPSDDGHGSQSNPNVAPTPKPGYQGGPAQPPPANLPPGYQPPADYQPYQQPGYQPSSEQQYQPYQQYQQPKQPTSPGQSSSQSGGQPGGRSGNEFKFEMPKDMPHSVKEVLPAGGFAGIFKMAGLPQLLKISYIMWLVAAGIWALISLALLVTSLVALGSANDPFGFGAAVRAAGARGIVVALISFALTAAIVLCAMKLKEGLQWARMTLSALALLSIVMMFFGGGGGLLAVVAAVLMWLPESTAWFNTRSANNQY